MPAPLRQAMRVIQEGRAFSPTPLQGARRSCSHHVLIDVDTPDHVFDPRFARGYICNRHRRGDTAYCVGGRELLRIESERSEDLVCLRPLLNKVDTLELEILRYPRGAHEDLSIRSVASTQGSSVAVVDNPEI